MAIVSEKSVVCTTLVGRSDEMRILRMLIERTGPGAGQMILISGEAGIGKSRLISQTLTYETSRGFKLLQGNCFQPDTICPYAPFLDLLRNQKSEDSAQERQILLAELSGYQGNSVSVDLVQAKRRLFEKLSQFLIHQAAQQPIAIVIEDVHWCDDTSLEFLHYLARLCIDQQIMLVVTYRSDEIQPGLRRWLTQLDRSHLAQEISLERLAQSEVNLMLRGIFSLDQAVAPEFVGAIHSLTDGNPFFIEEVLKSLITAGELFHQDGTWSRKPVNELRIPRSVLDAVQQRIEQLSSEAREIVTLVAVIGRRFNFELLQQLTKLDESQLMVVMNELVAALLVIEESADQFVFRHALTRQTIYSRLLTRERKKLHRSIAQMLEARYPNAPDSAIADLAYHTYEAGDWEKALNYSITAGELAQLLYAPHAAIEHFTRGFNAAQHLDVRPPIKLYRARGIAYESVGEFKQACADLEMALSLAKAGADRQMEWQVLLDLGMLWAGQDYAQTGQYYHQAFELARGMDDPKVLAHSLNRIGNWHVNLDQPIDGRWYHQEALTIFEQMQDNRGIAETLDSLGLASNHGGNIVQGAEYYQRAVPMFRLIDDRHRLIICLTCLTLRGPTYQTDTMISAGTLDEAAYDGDLALQLARQTGQHADEAFASIFLSIALGAAGEYHRAFPLAQSAHAIANEIDHRQWITASHLALGALYLDVLALEAAQQHLEKALFLANQSGSRHWISSCAGLLALTFIARKQPERAEALLNQTLDPALKIGTMGQHLLWRAGIELALNHGDGDAALLMLDRLTDTLMTAPGRSYSVRLLMLRGEAQMLLNQYEKAEENLQMAFGLAVDLGARTLQWRLNLSLARIYEVQKRYRQAEQCLKQARALVQQLAANIPDQIFQENFQQKITDLINRSFKLEFGGLTAREREVAGLVAAGRSNRQIADVLVVGERTIETHMGNILSKLNFTSRSQVAVWAVEHGLSQQTD